MTRSAAVSRRFTHLAALALLAVLGTTGCPKIKRLEAENKQLKEQKQKAEAEVQSANEEGAKMNADLSSIQENLADLRNKELKVLRVSLQGLKEGGIAGTKKEEILAEIESIRTAVKDNQKKLEDLEKQRAASGKKIKALDRLIGELRVTLAAKEATINELQGTITELKGKVDSLVVVVKEREKVISEKESALAQKEKEALEKEKEANKVHFLIARKSSLKAQGVIEKKGDIIGLGGNWKLTGSFDESSYTNVDLRDTNELQISAKPSDVKILTDHPKDTYKVEPDGKTASTLKIVDAKKFWGASRRLVIMVND